MRINEELVKQNYCHLLKRFDVLSILGRFSVEQFDQSERQYQRSISKSKSKNILDRFYSRNFLSELVQNDNKQLRVSRF